MLYIFRWIGYDLGRGALRTAHGFGGGCGEQKCSYDIRGCHTTLNLIYQVVICEEELLLQGFMRCTLLYTTVAGTTVPKSGILILKYFL